MRSETMKFVVKVAKNGRGAVLCDAETGEVVPNQERLVMDCQPTGTTVEVTLRFTAIPIVEG